MNEKKERFYMAQTTVNFEIDEGKANLVEHDLIEVD